MGCHYFINLYNHCKGFPQYTTLLWLSQNQYFRHELKINVIHRETLFISKHVSIWTVVAYYCDDQSKNIGAQHTTSGITYYLLFSQERFITQTVMCFHSFMVSCSCLFCHRTEANNYSNINGEIPTFAELLDHGFLEYDNIRQHLTLSLAYVCHLCYSIRNFTDSNNNRVLTLPTCRYAPCSSE